MSEDTNELMRLATMNISNLGEQMGLLNRRVGEQNARIADLESRMTAHEQTETVNRPQLRNLKRAVIGRVNYLLGIEFTGGRTDDEDVPYEMRYRGGFIARCYCDCKRADLMGESVGDTLRTKYDACMEYIGAWTPQVDNGVDGYKKYLDIRREERGK